MKNFSKSLIIIILILVLGGIFFWQKSKKPKEISLPETLPKVMQISSPVFENNSQIPSKYTCDGQNINPPLEIKDVPEGTQSLVLIVDDPDAPVGTFLHWLVFNINSDVSLVEEDKSSSSPFATTRVVEENSLPAGAIQGRNGFGKEKYGGPCPPFGQHRYFFKIYALDKKLDLASGSKLKEVESAMKNHILDQAQLIGLYQRK